MTASHRTIWQLAACDLQWQWWDEQLVVYHAASGDTHLLNLMVGEVLASLQQAPADVNTLVGRLAAKLELTPDANRELPEQVERLLQELESLGLVEAVPT